MFSVSIVKYFHYLTFTLLCLYADLQQSSRVRTTSHSSSIVDTVGETEVVVLQSSPVHHPYWQPVNSSNGNGSHDSSIDCGPSANSSTNATPIQQRRQRMAEQGMSVKPPLSQAKLEPPTGTNKGSLHSILQRTGSSRSVTGSQNIGCSNGLPKPKQHQRPSSLLVLGDDLNVERATPPTSPKHNVAFRSRSADDGHNNIKPPSAGSTSIITNLTSSLRAKMSNGSLAEGTVGNTSGSPSFLETPASSLEKLNRLKDRFMRTVTAPGTNISSSSGVAGVEGHADIDSDDESTPLVSEISTPAASSGLNVLASEFLNRGFAAVGGYSSHSDSSEDSPSSVKTTPISPPTVVIQQQQEQDIQEQLPAEADNGNIDPLINSPFMKDDNNMAGAENYVSSSCGSSVSLSQVLEPASNYYHLVAVSDSISSAESNVEDGSQFSSHEQLNDSDLKLSSNKLMLPSSSHLLRQDALDGSGANSCHGSRDHLDEWSNPETTV